MRLPVCRRIARELRQAWQTAFGKREMAMSVLDYERYWELQKPGTGVDPLSRETSFFNHIEENSTVLDIGCGTGRFLGYLLEKKRGVRVLGLDVAEEAINTARERGINCQVADVSSPDFELIESYDYIVIAEVLEHIPNPETLLLKLKENYRRALFISIPNIGYYPHRLRLLLGSFPDQTRWHPAEHLRYWTVRDFKEWLRELGYQTNQTIASTGFPILARLWPNLFSNQVVFIIIRPGNISSSEPS